MGSIPNSLLRHRATIEPYQGPGPVGDTYGPAVAVRCFAQPGQQLERSDSEDARRSQTTLYLPAGTAVPVGSRVTVAGQTGIAESVDARDAGSAAPNHVKVVIR